jgi:hypothetical protein
MRGGSLNHLSYRLSVSDLRISTHLVWSVPFSTENSARPCTTYHATHIAPVKVYPGLP